MYISLALFLSSRKGSQKVLWNNPGMTSWKQKRLVNIEMRSIISTLNESYDNNWLTDEVRFRFALQKLEKLSFKSIIPKFFDGIFQDFFLKSDVKNRAPDSLLHLPHRIFYSLPLSAVHLCSCLICNYVLDICILQSRAKTYLDGGHLASV